MALLARSAHLAEEAGTDITLEMVDRSAGQIERDKYVTLVRTAPVHFQAALAGAVDAVRKEGGTVGTGQAYEAYKSFCLRASIQPVTGRAFADLITEMDTYSLLRTRVISRGRYGRTREIVLDLSDDVTTKIYDAILINFNLREPAPHKGKTIQT